MGPRSAFPLFSKVTSALHACRAQWIPTLDRQHLLNKVEHHVRAWDHAKEWPQKGNYKPHCCLKKKLGFFEIALAHANTQPQACVCVKAACMGTHRTVSRIPASPNNLLGKGKKATETPQTSAGLLSPSEMLRESK